MKVYQKVVELIRTQPKLLSYASYPHKVKIVEVSPRDGL